MLAKVTSKNQLTLPKSVTNAVGPAEYFDVEARDGQIILTPVRIQRADAVRAKLAALDLTEQDVSDAVACARKAGRRLLNEPRASGRSRHERRVIRFGVCARPIGCGSQRLARGDMQPSGVARDRRRPRTDTGLSEI
jgi:hypothetical protein